LFIQLNFLNFPWINNVIERQTIYHNRGRKPPRCVSISSRLGNKSVEVMEKFSTAKHHADHAWVWPGLSWYMDGKNEFYWYD
jgi:hypothetical protein